MPSPWHFPQARGFVGKLAAPALIALLSACAGEESPGTGGSTAGSDQGGNVEGGGGSTSSMGGQGGGATGGNAQGGNAQGGNAQGGSAQGGAGGGTGGDGQGGSGLDPNDYPHETEENGTLAMANALPADALGFQAELPDINDIDVYSVFVPIGSTLRAQITDGMGGCPPGANVSLQIYGPDNLEIASQSGLCPLLNGNNDPDLNSIAVEGTYFIRVSTSSPVDFYVVEIEVAPPICGDGITQLGEECDDMNTVNGDGCENDCTETPVCGDGSVQTGEECDDGDTMSGDGCDSSCQLEGAFCPEAEPNNTTATATLITTCDGGAGQIGTVGDQDYYEVHVTVPGSSIRAEVTDFNPLACPTGFDSVLRLYTSGGAELGSDDQDGIDSCSLIDPGVDLFAQNLAVGTYFLRVEEYQNNATSQPYVLRISVLPPSCGDHIVQAGEECDDGNLVSGDGCDASCQLEGNFCPEVEPNNGTGTATPLAGCDGGVGAVTTIGDRDYYSIQVTVAGSSLRAETTDVNGAGCPSGTDTVIRLYNTSGTELGSDDDDGNSACSLIDPTTDGFAQNLGVGTYYVAVEEYSNDSTTPPYLLKLSLVTPGCGDHITQVGEECDDGNNVDGDGCSSTCTLEGNFCVESEPNDTFVQATALTTCDGGAGQINYISDSDWYSFQVTTAGSNARIEVVDTVGSGCPAGFDSFIRLFNSSMVQLGTDNDDGNASCSLISPATDAFATNLPVGTYYVRVEESGNDATSAPYLLLVDVVAPGCGDGFLQAGEDCDDGNTAAGDGCDATCHFEAGFCGESEPNDTLAQADDANSCNMIYARITAIGDKDWFRIDLPTAGSDLRIETYGTTGTTCPASSDTHIYLTDSAGNALVNDDDDGDGLCSLINPTVDTAAANLPAGTYYVRLEEHNNDATTAQVRLNIQILP